MRKRRRFTPEFKAQVILEVLAGTQSLAEACRKRALSPNMLDLWRSTFLERAHVLFQPNEQRDKYQARIGDQEQLLGRATRQIEVPKEALTLLDAASTQDEMLSIYVRITRVFNMRDPGRVPLQPVPPTPAG